MLQMTSTCRCSKHAAELHCCCCCLMRLPPTLSHAQVGTCPYMHFRPATFPPTDRHPSLATPTHAALPDLQQLRDRYPQNGTHKQTTLMKLGCYSCTIPAVALCWYCLLPGSRSCSHAEPKMAPSGHSPMWATQQCSSLMTSQLLSVTAAPCVSPGTHACAG
jgi:hypothetical protein